MQLECLNAAEFDHLEEVEEAHAEEYLDLAVNHLNKLWVPCKYHDHFMFQKVADT